MQTLKGKWWAKAIAMLLCITSIITACVGFAGMIYKANMNREDALENVYSKIADNYSAKVLSAYNGSDMKAETLAALVQKNVDPRLKLAIIATSQREWADDAATMAEKLGAFGPDADYLYGTPETVKQATNYFTGGDSYTYSYNTSSLIGMLDSGYQWKHSPSGGYEEVKRVWYVKNTGLFYYETDSGFYPVHSVCVTDRESTDSYTLTEITEIDSEVTYNADETDGTTEYDITTEAAPGQESTWQYLDDADDSPKDPAGWIYVQMENEQCAIRFLTEDQDVVDDQPGNYVYVVEDTKDLQSDGEGVVYGYEDTYISDYLLYTGNVEENSKETFYYVFSYVDESIQSDGFTDFFSEAEIWVDRIDAICNYAVVLELFSVIIFVLSLLFLICAAGHRTGDDEIHMTTLDKIWYEVVLGAVCILDTIFIALMVYMVEWSGNLDVAGFISIELQLATVTALVTLFLFLTTVTRIKAQKFWRYTGAYWCWHGISCVWKKIWAVPAKLLHSLKVRRKENVAFYREHMSLFWRTVVALCVASLVILISFVTMCVGGYYSELYVLWILIALILVWGVTLALVMQMTRLQEGGRRIAEGDLSNPIDTKGLYGDFKEHAENINKAGIGIAHAVEKQMKSERFKTELITNVSHDIKTPLTSIINYVDLIKKEEISDETLKEYVDVLDRQSTRLKKLIEDLIEASKASTGNLSVNFEDCDARVLLTQIVGEFEEKTAANQLEMIVQNPDHPVNVRVDSRHIWRVFDNLLGNICKYAQPGTRVYITLEQKNQSAIICFKNISKYQLNISNEELLERFVRGDSSRNTEGSGLGLSIAQSLTELMNGKMELAVDGDLFKVTLTFPVKSEN